MVAGLCGVVIASPSQAYEQDVHYGLNFWLALKAGFAEHEAEAMATGNARLDSGGPIAIDANLDYACASPDAQAAGRVQQAHFPASIAVPSSPSRRAVVAGSDVARQKLEHVLTAAKGQEGQMLSLFGRALHTYQDSWSHAGATRVTKNLGRSLRCDADLFLGAADTHRADLTSSHPREVLEMAKATFDVLATYPAIKGKLRVPAPWRELVDPISQFARARTKSEKQAWFTSEGVKDTSFLEGISLPDGGHVTPAPFNVSLLPGLTTSISRQYDAPEDQRLFFDSLFTTWIKAGASDESILPLLAANAPAEQTLPRLKLLKVRDHGLTAPLLHKKGVLSRSELARANTWFGIEGMQVQPATAADAFLPLVTKEARASPLLPYILRPLHVEPGGPQRVIAVTRLKHLPYDTQGWVAEKTEAGWKLFEVINAVDQ